ncbi:hypothetical protein EDC01DRAFT_747513 [Geopyxis carbonaria]|nr:hypothetical protein EDC01DRAFT_747513 [Geopyxis carbonaria]
MSEHAGFVPWIDEGLRTAEGKMQVDTIGEQTPHRITTDLPTPTNATTTMWTTTISTTTTTTTPSPPASPPPSPPSSPPSSLPPRPSTTAVLASPPPAHRRRARHLFARHTLLHQIQLLPTATNPSIVPLYDVLLHRRPSLFPRHARRLVLTDRDARVVLSMSVSLREGRAEVKDWGSGFGWEVRRSETEGGGVEMGCENGEKAAWEGEGGRYGFYLGTEQRRTGLASMRDGRIVVGAHEDGLRLRELILGTAVLVAGGALWEVRN